LTHERAAALAAARRHGLAPDEIAAKFGFTEASLDSAETPTSFAPAAPEREDELARRVIARRGPRG
jgi:hypothetical protein